MAEHESDIGDDLRRFAAADGREDSQHREAHPRRNGTRAEALIAGRGIAGTHMTPNITPLERAFALAKSGRCRTTEDIYTVLKKEGYPTEQVVGPWLLRQLRTAIDEASLSARGS